jgi:hypothetical protein
MPSEPGVPVVKTVHVVAGDSLMKPRYFDQASGKVIPNLVFVEPNGLVCFETNEVGLKGDRLDPARKTAVVWGDSVVFGAGWGWPCRRGTLAAGWRFLDGGVEGDRYDDILRRARDFNREHAAALNFVMLGWHPFRVLDRPRSAGLFGRRPGPVSDDREKFRSDVAAFLREIPNPVVLTMPTALNSEILDLDLAPFFGAGGGEGFTFCGHLPYARGIQRVAYEFIVERNAAARDVCAAADIPVVDLFAAFDTSGTQDFRRYFHDIMHFRPSLYPEVAEIVFAAIENLLR